MSTNYLPGFGDPSLQPQPTSYDVGLLVAQLLDRGWRTARDLSRLGYTDRQLRAIANESHGRIISGQQGYKATDDATDEEVSHAVSWLRSQAAKMETRAQEIMYRKFGPQGGNDESVWDDTTGGTVGNRVRSK